MNEEIPQGEENVPPPVPPISPAGPIVPFMGDEDLDLRPQFPADYDPKSDGGRLIITMALKEMPYADYLQTNHWKNVKAMAYRIYGRRCTFGANCEGPLDVHHHRYENLGNEPAEDMEVLCRKHHYAKHDRERQLMRASAAQHFNRP